MPSDAVPADRVAINNEAASKTSEFLSSLGRDDRTFVRLRFEEGVGQAAAVEALGVTRHRVRAWDEEIRLRFGAFLKR